MVKIKNFILLKILWLLNRYSKALKFKKELLTSKSILETNFSKKSDFNFIQIGANDGISFDFLYDFIVSRRSKGVVLEPVSEYYCELVENYKNYKDILPVNIAVHPDLKSIKIFKIKETSKYKYPDWVKGIASFDPQHHVRLKIETEDITEEIVHGDTLSNIINSYYLPKKIDYIQIDTEGFDFQILKMIDFKSIFPSMIKFESINLLADEKVKAIKILLENGYFIFDEIGDTIGIRLDKLSLI